MPLLLVLWINPSNAVKTNNSLYNNNTESTKVEICLDKIERESDKNIKDSDKLFKKERKGKILSKYLHKIDNKIFKPHKRVNMLGTEEFSKALESCTYNGSCLITSAFSHSKCHSKNSQHKKGEAIDIDWRNEGEQFLEWLDSSEGKTWLELNNLIFELENISSMVYHPRYRYNRKATGPHIHLHIKK